MLATRVVNAVASVDGVDPVDLEPLYDYIDPEILVRLSDQEGSNWSLSFQYIDHQVTVNHEAQILIDGIVHTV